MALAQQGIALQHATSSRFGALVTKPQHFYGPTHASAAIHDVSISSLLVSLSERVWDTMSEWFQNLTTHIAQWDGNTTGFMSPVTQMARSFSITEFSSELSEKFSVKLHHLLNQFTHTKKPFWEDPYLPTQQEVLQAQCAAIHDSLDSLFDADQKQAFAELSNEQAAMVSLQPSSITPSPTILTEESVQTVQQQEVYNIEPVNTLPQGIIELSCSFINTLENTAVSDTENPSAIQNQIIPTAQDAPCGLEAEQSIPSAFDSMVYESCANSENQSSATEETTIAQTVEPVPLHTLDSAVSAVFEEETLWQVKTPRLNLNLQVDTMDAGYEQPAATMGWRERLENLTAHLEPKKVIPEEPAVQPQVQPEAEPVIETQAITEECTAAVDTLEPLTDETEQATECEPLMTQVVEDVVEEEAPVLEQAAPLPIQSLPLGIQPEEKLSLNEDVVADLYRLEHNRFVNHSIRNLTRWVFSQDPAEQQIHTLNA